MKPRPVIWMALAYYYFHRRVLSRDVVPSIVGPLSAGAAMAGFLYFAQPLLWVGRAFIAVVIYFAVLLAFGNTAVRSWMHRPASRTAHHP